MEGLMTDYHDFTTRTTPRSERGRMGVGDLWINAARCLDCDEVVRSTNRHDFRSCSCGKVSVDGGSWYARRVLNDGARHVDIVEMYDDDIVDTDLP